MVELRGIVVVWGIWSWIAQVWHREIGGTKPIPVLSTALATLSHPGAGDSPGYHLPRLPTPYRRQFTDEDIGGYLFPIPNSPDPRVVQFAFARLKLRPERDQ